MSPDTERSVNRRAAAIRATQPGDDARIAAVVARVHEQMAADAERAQQRRERRNKS